MRVEEKINLIDNKKMLVWLNIGSIALLMGIFIVYGIVGISFELDFDFPLFAVFLIVMIGSLFLHEGIHGIFFWLFNNQKKVKFGFKNGMLYAMSPGTFYSKGKFLLIGISPFVVLTMIYLAVGRYYPNGALLLFAFHTAGCTGDFYYVYLLAKKAKGLLVEDTEQGITFYYPE